jgi:hypothetical protein
VKLKEIRDEIWGTLKDLKERKISPELAMEFFVGCNTIAKFIRLELDAEIQVKK